MSIVTSTVEQVYQKDAGVWYAIFRLTDDFGRSKGIKRKIFATDLADAQAQATVMLTTMETEADKSLARMDAGEAVVLGIKTAYKSALLKDVLRAWVKSAATDKDTLRAYNILSQIMPTLLAQGWNLATAVANLEMTTEEVQALNARWTYLNNNSASIESFKTISNGDNI